MPQVRVRKHLLAHDVSVHLREHQVEHDEVRAIHLERLQRGEPVADLVHVVAGRAEGHSIELSQRKVVLDDEDRSAHGAR